MFNFSILKRFPHRNKVQKYTKRAEKKQMKRQLKVIYTYIKSGDSGIRFTLSDMTVDYLRDKGYTVNKVTDSCFDNRYDIRW